MRPFFLLFATMVFAGSCGTSSPNALDDWKERQVSLGSGIVENSETLTSSAQRIDVSENQAGYRIIYELIQGRCAGVQVNGTRILIRGISSILLSTDPLFVVNGNAVDDISWINPNDVKTIDILKDADACSLYGTRGANGVILITLK